MKKIMIGLFVGIAVSVVAQTVVTNVSVTKFSRLSLVAGDRIVIAINPVAFTEPIGGSIVDYTVPTDKALTGVVSLSSSLK